MCKMVVLPLPPRTLVLTNIFISPHNFKIYIKRIKYPFQSLFTVSNESNPPGCVPLLLLLCNAAATPCWRGSGGSLCFTWIEGGSWMHNDHHTWGSGAVGQALPCATIDYFCRLKCGTLVKKGLLRFSIGILLLVLEFLRCFHIGKFYVCGTSFDKWTLQFFILFWLLLPCQLVLIVIAFYRVIVMNEQWSPHVRELW